MYCRNAAGTGRTTGMYHMNCIAEKLGLEIKELRELPAGFPLNHLRTTTHPVLSYHLLTPFIKV